jgi:hypothetical protein
MSKLLKVRTHVLVFLAGASTLLTLQGQVVKSDFSSMAASGKVNGDIYQNSILGITLSAPKAHWEVRGSISAARGQGRLIDAVYDSVFQSADRTKTIRSACLSSRRAIFRRGQHSTDTFVASGSA